MGGIFWRKKEKLVCRSGWHGNILSAEWFGKKGIVSESIRLEYFKITMEEHPK